MPTISSQMRHALVRAARWSLTDRDCPLLDAWRGNPSRNTKAIVDVPVRLSWLAVDLGDRLLNRAINPLIAGRVGAGVCAVDLRATMQDTAVRGGRAA
jgi:hypothetical protein